MKNLFLVLLLAFSFTASAQIQIPDNVQVVELVGVSKKATPDFSDVKVRYEGAKGKGGYHVDEAGRILKLPSMYYAAEQLPDFEIKTSFLIPGNGMQTHKVVYVLQRKK